MIAKINNTTGISSFTGTSAQGEVYMAAAQGTFPAGVYYRLGDLRWKRIFPSGRTLSGQPGDAGFPKYLPLALMFAQLMDSELKSVSDDEIVGTVDGIRVACKFIPDSDMTSLVDVLEMKYVDADGFCMEFIYKK